MLLPDFPMRDQLDEPTLDHGPDENRSANCVPASISAALTYLTSVAFYGDELVDAVYGEGYLGATDPQAYIPYCAQHGVKMWEVNGDGDTLVAEVLRELGQGRPVMGAIPSFWGNTTAADIAARGGPTHEIVFCGYDEGGSGTLTAMNPWPVDGHHAFLHTMPTGWWASRIVYRRVHPAALENAMLSNVRYPPGVPAGWHDDGTTLTAPNGVKVVMGFREQVLRGWNPANVPLQAEQAVGAQHTRQVFEYGILDWTPAQGVFEAQCGNLYLEALKQAGGHGSAPAPSPVLTGGAGKVEAVAQSVEAAIGKAAAATPADVGKTTPTRAPRRWPWRSGPR